MARYYQRKIWGGYMMFLVKNKRGLFLSERCFSLEVDEKGKTTGGTGWFWGGPDPHYKDPLLAPLHSEEDVAFMGAHPELWVGKDITPPTRVIPVEILQGGIRVLSRPIPFKKFVQTTNNTHSSHVDSLEVL